VVSAVGSGSGTEAATNAPEDLFVTVQVVASSIRYTPARSQILGRWRVIFLW
jgi:hypothetical protein